MNRKLFFLLIVFVLTLSFPKQIRAAWVDTTIGSYAEGLDKARGWDYSNPDCMYSTIPAPTALPRPDENQTETVNFEGHSSVSFDFVILKTISSITGVGQTNCTKRLGAMYKNSAIGTASNLIASMYANPPASGIEYIASSLRNFGLAEPAYAQGIGYAGLSPIKPIWAAFRNLSYIILVVVMVVVGFMVMFRMKLNAQTAITIQSAIPNIVLTLILITFSYAIAGLLIDLMYFMILLIISVFHQFHLNQELNGFLGFGESAQFQDATKYQEYFINANAWDLMKSTINFETIVGMPNALMRGVTGGLWQRMLEPSENVAQWIGKAAGLIFGGVVGSTGASLILGLLIAFALFIVFVRLFFLFLNSYIQILLAIILAPIQLLVGAVPGQNTFRNWIMGLIGNLIIFPGAVALTLLNMTISTMAIKEAGADLTGNNLWMPPFLFANPQGADVDASLPFALIGFGILMLTPTLLNSLKGIFAPKPFLPITPGLVVSPLIGTATTAATLAQQSAYLKVAAFGDKGQGGIWGGLKQLGTRIKGS